MTVLRSIGTLAGAFVAALVTIACLSLALGLAAGFSVTRSLSGGLLLCGSLLFLAGALSGLRGPRPGADARAGSGVVSVTLAGGGLTLVALGVLLDPETGVG